MDGSILEIPLAEKLTEADLASIKTLVANLETMEIEVTLQQSPSNNKLIFSCNIKANRRNAGRKEKPIPLDSPLHKMSQNQIDAWLLDNSIETIEKELNVGRATAFRRRANARERLEYAVVSLDCTEDAE